MTTKLLTICLLLVTSQVFAKEYTLYDCKVDGNEKKSYENYMACDRNCKKTNRKLKIKVNENTNKVLLQFFDAKDGSFVGQEILKTVKHDLTLSRGQTLYHHYTKELEIFDKENWTYLSSTEEIYLDNVENNHMEHETKMSMRNGIYNHIYLSGPRSKHNASYFKCGK